MAADIVLVCVLTSESFLGQRLPQNVTRWIHHCQTYSSFQSEALHKLPAPVIQVFQPQVASSRPGNDFHGKLKALDIEFPVPMDADINVEIASWAKSLFLSGKGGKAGAKSKQLFMLTTRSSTKVDLKVLAEVLGVKELRMGSAADMDRVLQVKRGCVTAMTVAMDKANECKSVIESCLLEGSECLRMCSGCEDALDHPNHKISRCPPSALSRLLLESGHTPTLLTFESDGTVAVVESKDAPQSEGSGIPAEEAALSVLRSSNISYKLFRHEPAHTIDVQVGALTKAGVNLDGALLLKNLFVKQKKKGQLVLVSARHNAEVNLNDLGKQLKMPSGSLRFAPENDLMENLKVPQGSVTPLALMNDSEKKVLFILDSQVSSSDRVLFHPNHNAATVEVAGSDLLSVCQTLEHPAKLLDFPTA